MLSARLTKLLNLLITTLTRCLRSATEHVAKIMGDEAENNLKITTVVQGTYPNFEQTLVGKEIFVISKVREASRCLANVVSEQQGSKSWHLCVN